MKLNKSYLSRGTKKQLNISEKCIVRNTKCFFVLTFFTMVLSLPSVGATDNLVLAKKTSKRLVDPVVMDGRIASEVLGTTIENLRLYAYSNGKFEPIRYQIEEKTGENGDWIFPAGLIPNGHLTNGKFDSWDVLVFMAEDTGDKAAKDAWVDGYTNGSEIEVTDPLTGEKGWVYLLYFASNVPARSQLPGYVRYNGLTHTMETDNWGAEGIKTPDGRLSPAYKRMWISKEIGGNGENFVDRVKGRVEAKFFFGKFTVRLHEETLKSGALAGMGGPVRLNVRIEHYYRIPGGFKVARVITDGAFFRDIALVPVMVNVPFKPNTVITSATVTFGTDYAHSIKGAAWTYNSENPQGFLVDGKMDGGEKNFDSNLDKWRVITGDFGSFMARTIFDPQYLKYGTGKMVYIDDETAALPPEKFPGSIGYLTTEASSIGDLPKGRYYFFVEWMFLAKYKPGDEVKYLNTVDHPLQIRSGMKQVPNNLLFVPTLCDMYDTIVAKEQSFSSGKFLYWDKKLGKYVEKEIVKEANFYGTAEQIGGAGY